MSRTFSRTHLSLVSSRTLVFEPEDTDSLETVEEAKEKVF
jgi:hypothetical protein